MLRTILGIVIGAIVWFAVVFVIGFAIMKIDPALSDALKAHVTMAAKWERLVISFVATLAAGAVAASIARDGLRGPLVLGVLLLAWFVYYHSTIWTQFPIWYHLTFFVSLPALSLLGGRLARR